MLSEAIDTYLKVRRTLGFKLFTAQGYLVSYARFAAKAGDVHMRTTTAIRWAKLGQSEASRAVRLNVLIRFARFAHAEERLHEVPPNHVFCHRCIRRHPYIFSDAEIVRILEQAQRLNPPGSLRPQTYSTLFGLLAATGMRISEALALRISDITPDGLIVRQTKFRKSRLVCLHDSVASAIGQYLVHRTKVVGADEHLFVSHRGGHPLGYAIAAETFQSVLAAAGVTAPPDRPRPRLHDLRHNSETGIIPRAVPYGAAPSELNGRSGSEILGIIRGSSGSPLHGRLAGSGVSGAFWQSYGRARVP
ncbi:MAG: tyrosine-type recombinase/integrase [Candidatus Accumulibacter phosphatis]